MIKPLALALLVAACGGKTAAPAAPLPDVPFASLDHAQQIEFMKQKVVPAMQPVFQKHDAKKYAEFGCATCHGDQAKDGHFDMPNAGLPKIGYTKEYYARFKPEDLNWMGTEVMPKMADLLKMKTSYTEPDPKDAFGCGNCHTFGEPKPAAPPQ
jgi:mono/diheme cytochrome c family protein